MSNLRNRSILSIKAPPERTYLIRKIYLTDFKNSVAEQYRVPRSMVTCFMFFISSILMILFSARVIVLNMIVVGVVIVLVRYDFKILSILVAVGFIGYNSIFYLLVAVKRFSIGAIKIQDGSAELRLLDAQLTVDMLRKRKHIIAEYIVTLGGSRSPWTLVDDLFTTVSLALMLAFFLSGMGIVATVMEWVLWVLYIGYMVADIILLGLPQAIFKLSPPLIAHEGFANIALQLISISFSLGLIASLFDRLRRSVREEEIFHGTAANLVAYIEKIAPGRLHEVMIMDCGPAPRTPVSTEKFEPGGQYKSQVQNDLGEVVQIIEIYASEISAKIAKA